MWLKNFFYFNKNDYFNNWLIFWFAQLSFRIIYDVLKLNFCQSSKPVLWISWNSMSQCFSIKQNEHWRWSFLEYSAFWSLLHWLWRHQVDLKINFIRYFNHNLNFPADEIDTKEQQHQVEREKIAPIIEIKLKDDAEDEKSYDYPFPDDKDSEFRKRCQERFRHILPFCWTSTLNESVNKSSNLIRNKVI